MIRKHWVCIVIGLTLGNKASKTNNKNLNAHVKDFPAIFFWNCVFNICFGACLVKKFDYLEMRAHY